MMMVCVTAHPNLLRRSTKLQVSPQWMHTLIALIISRMYLHPMRLISGASHVVGLNFPSVEPTSRNGKESEAPLYCAQSHVSLHTGLKFGACITNYWPFQRLWIFPSPLKFSLKSGILLFVFNKRGGGITIREWSSVLAPYIYLYFRTPGRRDN